MWQKHILKYGTASKDKAILEIMEGMKVALGEEGCDSDGKYEVFFQLQRNACSMHYFEKQLGTGQTTPLKLDPALG